MVGRPGAGKARAGTIDMVRSGSLRVRVYAGVDPVTGKRHDLVEVVPPGSKTRRQAEATLARFLREIDEKRNPRTTATVDQLPARYLDRFDGSPNTLELYRTHVRDHVSPCLGHLRVGEPDAETLGSFYAELCRCRSRCRGRARVEHRVEGPHECTERCRRHEYRPLAPTTIRPIHFVLSGPYPGKAARWGWMGESPMEKAQPPAAPK